MGEKLLTAQEVAKELNITTDQIRRLVFDGDLPAINVGRKGAKRRRLRFAADDIEAFKQHRQVRPLPATTVRPKRRAAAANPVILNFIAQQRIRAEAKAAAKAAAAAKSKTKMRD